MNTTFTLKNGQKITGHIIRYMTIKRKYKHNEEPFLEVEPSDGTQDATWFVPVSDIVDYEYIKEEETTQYQEDMRQAMLY